MAGDWLKIQVDTPDKPEIETMADHLGIDPDSVFGKCFKVWRWFDAHTQDGNASGVTKSAVDRRAGVTGFALAMELVGWLRETENGIELPNFDRHNGKTAKKRALTASRVSRSKSKSNAKSNAKVTQQPLPDALPREEKRREDIPTPLPPASDNADRHGWEGVGERLKGRGVMRPAEAIANARGNGVEPAQVEALIDHYDNHPGAWEAGALYQRVLNATPDLPPGKGWPEPTAGYQLEDRLEQRERYYREQQRRREEATRRKAAERQREAELERRHGAAVDALDRSEAERILRDRLGTEAAAPFINRWTPGEPADGIARSVLIESMEEN